MANWNISKPLRSKVSDQLKKVRGTHQNRGIFVPPSLYVGILLKPPSWPISHCSSRSWDFDGLHSWASLLLYWLWCLYSWTILFPCYEFFVTLESPSRKFTWDWVTLRSQNRAISFSKDSFHLHKALLSTFSKQPHTRGSSTHRDAQPHSLTRHRDSLRDLFQHCPFSLSWLLIWS